MSNSLSDYLVSALQGASNAAASNVTGPVDMLAWALRKAGVPVPSNPILGSEWMRQKGLMADPRNKLAGLLGEGVGLAAPFAVAAKAPQIAGGLLRADDAMTAGANRLADHFENTAAAYKYDPKQRGSVGGDFKLGGFKSVDVYHGATNPVSPETFDVLKGGSSSRHASAEVPVMWTSRSPKVAQMFINESVRDLTPLQQYGPRGAGTQAIGLGNAWKDGANVVPMKATLQNPYVIRGSEAEKVIFGTGDWRDGGEQFTKIVQAAKEAGHDGVIIKANPRGSLEFRANQYLLFDPASQAKSKFSGSDSSNALANALRSKD